eukprot:6003877-Amphidinium_carterae.1
MSLEHQIKGRIRVHIHSVAQQWLLERAAIDVVRSDPSTAPTSDSADSESRWARTLQHKRQTGVPIIASLHFMAVFWE